MISESDFSLFIVTDDLEVAIAEIVKFYEVYHSYRYVGDKLVVRLQLPLTDAALTKLNGDFSDIIKSGEIVQCEALQEEGNEPDLAEMARIRLSASSSKFRTPPGVFQRHQRS